MSGSVDHPPHYGGADSVYEAIKVIEAWGLGFNLGNSVKYLARAGRKDPARELEDLEKARWYLDREISARRAAPAAEDAAVAESRMLNEAVWIGFLRECAFGFGDVVRKRSGSAWEGRIVGFYSTRLTPFGVCVESASHPVSVQIYPVAELDLVKPAMRLAR